MEGKKREYEWILRVGCPHRSLLPSDNSSATHLGFPHAFYSCRVHCIVYMSCFTEVGEGGTGTSGIFGSSFATLGVWREENSNFGYLCIIKTVTHFRHCMDWKDVHVCFFPLLKWKTLITYIQRENTLSFLGPFLTALPFPFSVQKMYISKLIWLALLPGKSVSDQFSFILNLDYFFLV